MIVQKIESPKCPTCNSTNVTRKNVVFKRKVTNVITSCFECRKDYSERDGEVTEHKNRPFYGRSGVNVSRYEMGDYKDHQGN